MPGASLGGQTHPPETFFRSLHQVEATVGSVRSRNRQREAADLTHGLGHSLEQIRAVLDQPLASVLSARFLVRHESEHQITRRYDAFRLELSGEGQDHPDHVLHVHGAAPPDVNRPGRCRQRDGRSSRRARPELRRGDREASTHHDPTRLPSSEQRHFLGRVLRTRRIPSRNRLLEAARATHSAHARSPLVVSSSPVFEVSKRMRELTSSTTSASALLGFGLFGVVVIPLSYHRIKRRGRPNAPQPGDLGQLT